MLSNKLEIAYMIYTVSFMVGYFINYVSGIILDVQGMQYLIAVCLIVSLPPYLLGEWIHKFSNRGKRFLFQLCNVRLLSNIADYCYLFHIVVILCCSYVFGSHLD